MANMNDVAKLAGVSRGTVSNYINGVNIKEKSRVKVEAAIKELGYIPNLAARELKTQKSNFVVFILPTIWNPFFSELTYHLQLELKKHQLKMLLCNSQDDYRQELEYIQMAQEQKVMGIITISYSDITPYLTANLPLVSIERYFNEQVPFVTSDNFGGGCLAAQKLVEKGCQRLLMFVRDIPVNLGLMERRRGFTSYCQEHGIEYEVFADQGASSGFRGRVHEFIHERYQEGIPYDGIFGATDRYADYCLTAFETMDYRIPEDIQVIGFDGSKSYQHEVLSISTIRQPVKEIAIHAVEQLRNFSANTQQPQEKIILPVSFVEAKTTRKV